MPQMQPQQSQISTKCRKTQAPLVNAADLTNVYESMSINEPMAANMMGGS